MTRARGGAGIVWLAAAALAAPAPAAAEDVTAAQLAERAAAAADNPSQLDAVTAVTAVDGRPLEIEAALAGVNGEDLRERLERLAAEAGEVTAAGPPPRSAESARGRAGEIIGELRERPAFEEPPPAIDEAGDGGGVSVPAWVWISAALAALAVGLVIARRLARGRELSHRARREEAAAGEGPDPRALEAAALAAEDSGDYAEAVRLRFRIAIAELAEAGAIVVRPSLTPHEVGRQLGDDRADGLIGAFERIVYGRREAGAEDAAAARRDWPAVVAQRSSR